MKPSIETGSDKPTMVEQTITSHEMELQRACEELAAVLISKNKDYGNSANREPLFVRGLEPETALLIRLNDKVRRLDSLLTKETADGSAPAVANETIDDTLLDLAGYAILIRSARRRKNELK